MARLTIGKWIEYRTLGGVSRKLWPLELDDIAGCQVLVCKANYTPDFIGYVMINSDSYRTPVNPPAPPIVFKYARKVVTPTGVYQQQSSGYYTLITTKDP